MNNESGKNNWHALTVDEVLKKVNSNLTGLTIAEVKRRQQIYGANQLIVYKKPSLIIRFLRQFHNVLIYILLCSALITILLTQWVDTSVILGVVIINAIFGLIQEGKAERALAAIRDMLAPTANVVREGNSHIIAASELIVGDIVVVKAGDKVPADLRLFEVKNLRIQESILTGESVPVDKQIFPNDIVTSIHDRTSMAYSGTMVTSGRGTGIVVACAHDTEVGKISTMLAKLPQVITPLLQQMDVFGRGLTVAIILLAIATYLVGALIWHDSSANMFMAIVGLTVAAVPEGLPPIMTIILAIGVMRMAKRNAIVRRLPVVETMGSVTTICTDKTGTLTFNELEVQCIVCGEFSYCNELPAREVSISPHLVAVEKQNKLQSNAKDFILNGKNIVLDEHVELKNVINAAILCNDLEPIRDGAADSIAKLASDPLEIALLRLAPLAKINIHLLLKSYPRTDLIPYESEHKFMATLHHDHAGNGFIYVKGAPEKILNMCTSQRMNNRIEALNLAYWNERIVELARQGQKVIALAYKETSAQQQHLNFSDVESGLTIIAVLGLLDLPRKEALSAVKECQMAGIKVKMITGDHAATAITIAEKVGIDVTYGCLTGQDIDAMDDTAFAKVVSEVNVYARTTPQHKLRLVKALQVCGEVVAMTGDGINDAPALKQANIGIAMGRKGAEIAKEASAMVLVDDNFATIVHAVEEGRTIYDNLKKAILYILPTNIAQAFSVIVAILFGMVLPITAVQILWVNMISAVTLALALGFEPVTPDVMKYKPRPVKAPLLSGFLMWRTAFVSLVIVASVFILFLWERSLGVDLNTARSVAVNVIVLAQVVYLINCRRIYTSVLKTKIIFGGRAAWIAIAAVLGLQVLFTYVPIMQHFFGSAALDYLQWLRIGGVALIIFLLIEGEKWFVRLLKPLS